MLTSGIQNPNRTILDQFPSELLYKGPALIICNRAHQDHQNAAAFDLMRNNCLSTDKNRYPRSIDIESELYLINRYGDKCFYDNYKLDPRTMPHENELYKNRNALVHDYSYYQSHTDHQDTAWQSPRPLSTTPGGSAKPPMEQFSDIAWNLAAHRDAVANLADAPNQATQNQCDAFHAYNRTCVESDTTTAACGVGLPDQDIIRTALVAQVGPLVPGIRAHKVEQGGWKQTDTRMKQYPDGVLKQQLDADWSKFKVRAADGNCVKEFQHFPRAPVPLVNEKLRPGQYYNKPDGEPDSGASAVVRQVFPISPEAQFYSFQQNCPQFKSERLFYNISKNRMTPNTLNYTNFNNEWKGENLRA